MGNQVSQQLLVFGQSILLGFSAGLLYDLLRPFRLRLPRLTGLLDSLYCLAVGVAAFLFLLQAAEGRVERGLLKFQRAGCRLTHRLSQLVAVAVALGQLGQQDSVRVSTKQF